MVAMPSARQRAAAAKKRAKKKKQAAAKKPVIVEKPEGVVAASEFDVDTEDAEDYRVGGYHPVKVRSNFVEGCGNWIAHRA